MKFYRPISGLIAGLQVLLSLLVSLSVVCSITVSLLGTVTELFVGSWPKSDSIELLC